MSNDMLGTLLKKIVGLPAEMLGSLYDLTEKLGGEDGEIWFSAFKRFLRKGNSWQGVGFPTWKTVKLGTGLKTADDFRKALKASGCRIGDWANDILGKSAFSAATKESELELVRVSVRELGFKNGSTRQNIYRRAQELRLKICPNEVGPQLRLQYKDQPNGEWVVVAMEPIPGSGGSLGLFSVEHDDDDQWLVSHYDYPDDVWDADDEFVFCK